MPSRSASAIEGCIAELSSKADLRRYTTTDAVADLEAVRKAIGAQFEGTPVIQRVQSTHIRAPGLLSRLPGKPLRLIGVHAKSKAPHGQMSQAQFIRISIENRRKQLAECQWLRRRIDSHLAAGASVIVLGDLNDGPGLDEYEKLFGHSGVEIVLGLNSGAEMHLYDPHAHMALAQKTGISPTTARFWLAPQKRYFEALLDFIMVSPDLAARAPDWRIWHPFNDPAVMAIPELRDALLTASDHFPVTIDLEIN